MMNFLFKNGGLNLVVVASMVVFTVVFIFFTAIVSYIAFWWYMVPEAAVSMPLYFSPTTSVEYASSKGTCQAASLNTAHFPTLTSDDYSLELQLVLPRSSRNREAGTFGTYFEQSNSSIRANWYHESFHHAEATGLYKSSIVPYRSPAIELLHNLAFAPLHVFNLLDDAVKVNVPFLENQSAKIRNDPSTRIVNVLVCPPLDISAAELTWRVQLRGIRWAMSRFPLASFFIGTGVLIFTEFVGVFIGIIIFTTRSKSTGSSLSSRSDTPAVGQTERRLYTKKDRLLTHNGRHDTSDETLTNISDAFGKPDATPEGSREKSAPSLKSKTKKAGRRSARLPYRRRPVTKDAGRTNLYRGSGQNNEPVTHTLPINRKKRHSSSNGTHFTVPGVDPPTDSEKDSDEDSSWGSIDAGVDDNPLGDNHRQAEDTLLNSSVCASDREGGDDKSDSTTKTSPLRPRTFPLGAQAHTSSSGESPRGEISYRVRTKSPTRETEEDIRRVSMLSIDE